MNPEEINYSGQYLNNTEYRIKVRTGSDIERAPKDAICGEMLLVTGANPCVYVCTETAGENDAVLYKMPDLNIWDIVGNYSNHYSLEVFSPIQLPSYFSDLINGNEWTLSIWFKKDASRSGNYGQLLGDDTGLFKLTSSNAFSPNLYLTIPTDNGAVQSPSTITFPENEVWSNAIFTKTASQIVQYKNGTQVNNPWDISSLTLVNAGNFRFNNSSYGSLISNVAVFDRAITSAEASSISRDQYVDVSVFNPSILWRMGDNDGGVGSSVTDIASGYDIVSPSNPFNFVRNHG
jgi:hypothetical protein